MRAPAWVGARPLARTSGARSDPPSPTLHFGAGRFLDGSRNAPRLSSCESLDSESLGKDIGGVERWGR